MTENVQAYAVICLTLVSTVVWLVQFALEGGVVDRRVRKRGVISGQKKRPDFDDWLKGKQKEKAKPYHGDSGDGPVIDV